MRLILFSGTHSRHLFIMSEVLKHCDEVLSIIMEREEVIPSVPKSLNNHDKLLFEKHFANRKRIEDKNYGDLHFEKVFENCKSLVVSHDELNSVKVANEVSDFRGDMAFIFGSGLILNPVFSALPKNKINIHLGLSPWYRGAATLFWPFYLLQPQFCGVTFHQISNEPDAGELIHQLVPRLELGDTIHDVGAKCIIEAKNDLHVFFNFWKLNQSFPSSKQKVSGRNWLQSDFHPSMLRIIYDLFDDKIVDLFLKGEISGRLPRLFSCIK